MTAEALALVGPSFRWAHALASAPNPEARQWRNMARWVTEIGKTFKSAAKDVPQEGVARIAPIDSGSEHNLRTTHG